VPKEYYQGKPIGYNIIYHPADLEGDSKLASVNYITNTTILTDLAVYTMYVVNVSAVSSGGVGPAKMVITRTDAEGNTILRKC